VLGLDSPGAPSEVSDDQLHQYIMGMVQAFSALLPPRREPTDEEVAEQGRWSELRRDQIRRYADRETNGATPTRRRRVG
jgi:hypothetical protein